MLIRPAQSNDLAQIGKVHASSWQSAYRGMLHDEYLDDKVEGDLRDHWHATVLRNEDVVLVAEDQGIIGFIAVWCQPEPLIDNLHVSPEQRSGGVGAQLFFAAAKELERLGHTTAYLWVLADNYRAIQFYERLGGVRTELKDKEIFENLVPSYKIEWSNLADLRA